MTKPYIICHMMTSIDGRIDCDMTSKLAGVQEYYNTLEQLNIPTTLSGRVTAELEMANPGKFQSKSNETYGHEGFSKAKCANSYEIIVDSKGTLLWPDTKNMDKPYLIMTTIDVSKEYLDYLDQQHISWIVCGQGHVDLKRATEILAQQFSVTRLGIVGGPIINTAFLEAGLLDEISILIGPGIDARKGFTTLFDGLDTSHDVIPLKLLDVQKFDSGAIWIRYTL